MIAARFASAAVAVAAVATLAACGSDDAPKGTSTPVMPTTSQAVSAPTTTKASPKVLAPTDTGVSTGYGVETLVLSVEDTTSRYGPVTVFTFQLVNTSDRLFEGYNWPSPTVVYGPAGTPAESVTSLSEGYGAGVQGSVPPGSRQTVKHAYKVVKSDLNPAVVSVGSIVWQGDWTAFQR